MRRDWDRIKAEYVTGTETLRQLAERLELNPSTLFARASKDGWVEAKEAEAARIRESVRTKARERRIKREALALDRVETQLERLLREIERALEDEGQLYRHVLYVDRGIQGERLLEKMDTKAARDFVAMLTEMQAALSEMGGVLDKKTADEIRLKKQRLKLDQRRWGLTEKSDEEETGVVILPEVANDEPETVTIE